MTDTLQSLAGRLGVGTLAVATICATFPPPAALAAPVSRELLAQAYEPPPAYPPTEPPPAYPPTEPPPQGYAPPPPAYAPQFPSSDAQAMADARADVPQEISGTLWFFAGFFLTWVGILLGYLLEPTPDGARLVGKSPAYVTTYTTTYKSEGKSYQGIHAVYGCVTSGVLYVILIVLIVVFDVALAGASGA